jgi:hypothetical protein
MLPWRMQMAACNACGTLCHMHGQKQHLMEVVLFVSWCGFCGRIGGGCCQPNAHCLPSTAVAAQLECCASTNGGNIIQVRLCLCMCGESPSLKLATWCYCRHLDLLVELHTNGDFIQCRRNCFKRIVNQLCDKPGEEQEEGVSIRNCSLWEVARSGWNLISDCLSFYHPHPQLQLSVDVQVCATIMQQI